MIQVLRSCRYLAYTIATTCKLLNDKKNGGKGFISVIQKKETLPDFLIRREHASP
jgi:hypothetical protein